MTDNPSNWFEVAVGVFKTGKRLAPARFPALPRPDDGPAVAEFRELCGVWAEELERINLAPQIWQDAVRWWCRNVPQDRRWDISEARKAGFRVRDEWEQDPARRLVLDRWRSWYLQQRVQRGELPAGSTPVVSVQSEDARAIESADGKRPWREILAETRRRAAALPADTPD